MYGRRCRRRLRWSLEPTKTADGWQSLHTEWQQGCFKPLSRRERGWGEGTDFPNTTRQRACLRFAGFGEGGSVAGNRLLGSADILSDSPPRHIPVPLSANPRPRCRFGGVVAVS
ncbi:hypothetical protein D0A40_14335 [Xanthomonas campestris pv. raphani]|nr:hypothetical protein D0A40_14335 [Xanthomonas campestris pv. raphani]